MMGVQADGARWPVERLVTPSLSQLSPERLAEVVRGYREELRVLAERHAYHACGWALEAIDTLIGDTVELLAEVERLRAEGRRGAATARAAAGTHGR